MSNRKGKHKKVVVAVSGGFDPLHAGHVRLFKQARAFGDELVVILNNDNWLREKKGYVFMNENERKEILEALSTVDRVVITKHPLRSKDMSVSRELRAIHPNIFANGGDRHKGNVPEVAVCAAIGCTMIDNVGKGGKVQSSSWLLVNYLKLNQKKARRKKTPMR